MRIISRQVLRDFWDSHTAARQALQAWHANVKHARWKALADIKREYQSARFVGNNRVVFNIKGNKYWIIVAVQYRFRLVFIRFVGIHQECGQIDANTV